MPVLRMKARQAWGREGSHEDPRRLRAGEVWLRPTDAGYRNFASEGVTARVDVYWSFSVAL